LNESLEWFGPAEALNRLRIAGINKLRLVAWEQYELWFEVELSHPSEENPGKVTLF
jgi:hypothetical protein